MPGRRRAALKTTSAPLRGRPGREVQVERLIAASLEAVNGGDYGRGAEQALAALEIDETNGYGWWLLAIARENADDAQAAFLCFERALSLLPQQVDIARDLGRVAAVVGETGRAVGALEEAAIRVPETPELIDALACVLRDARRFDEATERVRATLGTHPGVAVLWNTLGTLMMERGDTAKAIAFYGEALRLEPGLFDARHNLSAAFLAAGEPGRAVIEADKAIAAGAPIATAAVLRVTRALAVLASGDLARGWAANLARLAPDLADATHFQVERPAWTPGVDLAGKSLLVVGEQGLGDELMFANVLPDVIEALGGGRLTLAVEPRLVSLFARSFPAARVGAHATTKTQNRVVRTLPFLDDADAIDLWAPLGSLLAQWRASVEDFPQRPGYLRPDPARVAYWRERLAELGPEPKVGVLCANLQQYSSPLRWLDAVEAWSPVLATPGVQFVDLQYFPDRKYGDHAAAMARTRAAGHALWTPPGLDLKQDLDEVAALCCALDLIISAPNATSSLAAACGAPVWLLAGPRLWPQLGTDRLPWYPQARVFSATALDDWTPVMAEVAQALAAL
jgi:tetratricopeptide (TPR) repeat protein